MPDPYEPQRIEARWQRRWAEARAWRAVEDARTEKSYVLEMFPYPSGRIHMGHVRNYSIGDVLARYDRLRGKNVLHPMGWDAFGLPAENAAIQHATHPARWTAENIAAMRAQLHAMGFSYDWERELSTADPAYYRWEQWLFIKMWERGLAYRKDASVNWCEVCQTVLANEQAEGGRCWRCEGEVTQRDLVQWFFRITAYADELLAGLDTLSGWPERVLTQQRNWIGRSEGVDIDFPLVDGEGSLRVFTTRPDTLFGVTFMVLAPEHPLTLSLASGAPQEEEVRRFVARARRLRRAERTADAIATEGIALGRACRHPLTGEVLPLYTATFVLMEYGTGAVMSVPAHDERDFTFARHHGLPVRVVITPPGPPLDPSIMAAAYLGDGIMVNSGPFTGHPNREGMREVTEALIRRGRGRAAVMYRLRDWGISRQRYWGAPVPMIHCRACGIVPARIADLPVVLPENVRFTGEGPSPLAEAPDFVETPCPACGGVARRDTDTMDTFVESSWYFARFCSPEYGEGMLDERRVDYWMPVDQYIGGIEHAVMHLLYARFLTKVLRDMGIVKVEEPFTRLLTQGMVVNEGAKMSKSKGNIVEPDDLIARYGADTVRLFCLFAAPPEKDLEWSDQGVEGVSRFVHRVWRLVTDRASDVRAASPRDLDAVGRDAAARELRRLTHETLRRVTDDVSSRLQFNTAISRIMELVNALMVVAPATPAQRAAQREAIETLVVMLSPFAPHIAEELWERLGYPETLHGVRWPAYDPALLVTEEVSVVVQVNGKVRGQIVVPATAGEETYRAQAEADARVARHLAGRTVRRVVVVPKKLINFVVDERGG